MYALPICAAVATSGLTLGVQDDGMLTTTATAACATGTTSMLELFETAALICVISDAVGASSVPM